MTTQPQHHPRRPSVDLEQRITELEREVVQLKRDLAEGVARENAIAEILKVIAGSPADLQPVLDAIAASATRLSDSSYGSVGIVVNDEYRIIAAVDAGMGGALVGYVAPVSPRRPAGRALLERRTIHIPDRSDPAFVAEFPDNVYRQAMASLSVPLVREGPAIGVLTLAREVARAYSPRDISLVETFADQAVIAIENARLFRELAELNWTLEARVSQQVEELERVGRLRRYLSPQLADLIVSSGDESILESHRRLITVVFCDLRGFTAFAETAEPEEVTGVLAEYHAAMGALIHRFGGTLDRFAGDGIMVFFNDPVPQPDHAERAVGMACAMRERAADLARGWRRAGYELGFGVGIAMGHATLGRIGFEGRYDYTAIGTVANLAARLCDEAGGG
nr:GAF domain-containing protein [Chloroflexota bacterium]